MAIKTSSAKTLASFCQNHSSFRTKLALLSFYKAQYPKWLDQIILLLEYLQLISQILLLPDTKYDSPEYFSYPFQVIVYFFKIINPSFLLRYGNNDATTETILSLIFVCVMAKLALFLYVLCVALWDCRKYSLLLFIWRWIFRLQTRGIYFLFTSFWVTAVVKVIEYDMKGLPISKAALISLSVVVILTELLLCYMIDVRLCNVLTDKNYLSSKNNTLTSLTLFQKLMMQVLIMILRSDSEANAWVISVIGLVLSMIRVKHFYTCLPLYHYKALLLQGSLLMIASALNLVYFLNTFLGAIDFHGAGINFIISTWIVVSVLAYKISRESLSRIILRLLSQNTQENPEREIHKVLLAKELKLNESKPGDMSLKYHFTHLLTMNQSMNLAEIYGVKIKGELSKKTIKKIYMLYCEELMRKFPDDLFVKLHLAKAYFKNSQPYTKIIKLSNEINKNKWSKEFLSSSLLLYEIEKSMLENSNEEKEINLDILTFIKSKLLVEKFKNKILKQIDLYINVCDNITSEVSDIGEIYTSGQQIGKSKQSVQKMMDKLSQRLPEYYVSPYLIYAEYHLILNYSLKKFDRFVEIFAQKYLKNERHFKEACLIEENLYQDSNVFLLLSSQKNQFGQILFSTKSLQDLCGNNSNEYINTNITNIFPSSLKSFYEDSFKHNFSHFTNKIHRSYIYHKNKHLIEVDFSLKYHPYLNQNLCLDMIIRKVPKAREFLLVREDGFIEGASKGIFRILKLKNFSASTAPKNQMVHLKAISEELAKINLAFNMVQQQEGSTSLAQVVSTSERKRSSKVGFSTMGDFAEGPSTQRIFNGESSIRGLKLTYQQAVEIHAAFAKEDQKVQIFPFEAIETSAKKKKNDRQSYEFYCNVQMLSYGTTYLKLINFQDLLNDDKQSRIFSDREPERATSINFVTENPHQKYTLKDEEEDEEGSENFNANEREAYDPETVTSFRRQLFTTMSPVSNGFSPTTQADLPLISVTSENRKFFSDTLFTTYRIDLSPKTAAAPEIIPALSKRRTLAQIDEGLSNLFSNDDDDLKHTDGRETPEINILDKKNRVQKYLSSHGSSQKYGEKASNKAFKAAILAKSYPKSFRTLCVVFYGVILLTFISQIIMKFVSDDTMTDLTIKKDLLKYSEQRSYRAMMQVVNVVGGVLEIQGALAVGGAISGLDVVADNLLIHSKAMNEANNEMIKNTNALDDEIQKKLFEPNVRMYGTYSSSTGEQAYENMTSFQAAAKLINAAETFAGLDEWVSLAGYNSLYYIDANTMNDFESECFEITQTFIDSVEQQKEQYQNTTTICLVLTPFLLIGIGILLTMIILNQYRIEKKQMNALIKVRSSEMKEIFARIKKFQRGLVNEEISEYNWFHNITEDLKIVSSLQIEQRVPVYSKKQDDQLIKYKKFRKRYYQYILRVVLYISALVAINMWDWISTKHSTKLIYNLENQLQFANHVSNRVTVAYTSFALLFTTNNTMLIERKKPLQVMKEGAAETKNLQNEVIYKFQDINGEYNPEVKSILFDDDSSCSRIKGDNNAKCALLVNTGQPINMISALSVMQNLLMNKYQDYESADKSTMPKLLAVAFQNIATLLPNFVVIVYEAQDIAKIIDEVLTGKIEEIKRNRSWVLGVFSVGLVVVSVLIWFHILKRIREVYNDFKKVLQIFPPGLVLSSYLLKKFLKRTSDRSFLL